MTIPTRTRPRQGFTLVEMLVVIVIIGILAGLITAAAFRARIAAKQAVIKMEMSQLEMALENYKSEVGDYPPDCVFLQTCTAAGSDAAALTSKAQNDILRHIRKRFPRFTAATSWTALCNHIMQNDGYHYPSINLNTLDPSRALFFFLGGLPERNTGDWVPAGFHSDPTDPFRTGGPRTKPFFEFNRDRIEPFTGSCPRFYPPYLDKAPTQAPYVYFKCRSKEYGATDPATPPTKVYPSVCEYDPANNNIAVAYLEPPTSGTETTWRPDVPGNPRLWRSPAKFQIICSGLDGKFGEGHVFRYTKAGRQLDLDGANPVNLNADNFDNLTNFAEGTLEDEM